jgi:hypothetical protein
VETAREYHCIFDCETAALAQVWRRGMNRVAEQRDSFVTPLSHGFAIVRRSREDQLRQRRFDQLDGRRVPAFEQPQQFVLGVFDVMFV